MHVDVNGKSQEVATLEDEDYFGEMSLLTGEVRSASVVAQTDCEVLELDKQILGELFQKNPCLMERLSALLAERRMQMEGVLATKADAGELHEVQKAYTARFIQKLASFFEL